MKKFSYTQSGVTGEEDYFAVRTKRVNRGRIFYLIALWIIILSALLYVADRIYWVRFVGELSHNLRYTTFPDDIYVLKVNFREGDKFQAGDTLFWYCSVNVNMGPAWGTIDGNNLLDPIKARNDVAQKEHAVKVYTDRMRELKQQLTILRKQLFLGVATSQDVKKCESEIAEMNVKIELAQGEVKTARELFKAIPGIRFSKENYGEELDSVFNHALADFGIDISKTAIIPWCAKYDASVFRVNVFPPAICYKKDFVLGIQIDEPAFADIHIIMWSETYKVEQLKVGDIVDVKIGNKYYPAQVSLEIPTIQEVPAYLEQNFEKEKRALTYRLDFLYPEQLETWQKVHGIPLTIRKKRKIFQSIQRWFEDWDVVETTTNKSERV
ncbi:MAG: hypothetical protein LBR65_02190 [Culturomica sp.]|jgi:hypothetical protein|nr:hypothetical protein [Culturomica sp.]